MRVIVLAAVIVASMPYISPRLPSGTPSVYVSGSDCEAARRNATAIAAALGYSKTTMNCGHRPGATLGGEAPAKIASVPELTLSGGNEQLPSSPPPIAETVQIPSAVPFVAGTGSVVGYVKVDALLVSLETQNPVQTAFALENKGVPRRDIASLDDKNFRIVVRVRPVSAAQIEKIASVVLPPYDNNPVRLTIGFIANCDRAVAALGGVAAARAREHAGVLAKAAGTRLGSLLGVVDSGFTLDGARCSAPGNASVKQLVLSVTHGYDGDLPASFAPEIYATAPQLYATVVRRVSAAWRIDRPSNPRGSPWQLLSEFFDRWWTHDDRPAFIADGQRMEGDSLLPDAVRPDRVRILLPDWAVNAAATSRYKNDLTYISLGVGPTHAVVDFRADTTARLQKRIDDFSAYLSRRAQNHALADLQYFYSRADCSTAVDDALYAAARSALDKTGHMRYLEERTTPLLGQVSCLHDPNPDPRWVSPDAGVSSAAGATVTVGY